VYFEEGMPRYFTLAEAHQVLPKVEQALRDVLFHKAEYQSADQELKQHMQRIQLAGGFRVSPGPILALKARRDASAAAVQDAMDRVEQLGALVKDLDIGLIDFLTVYRDREVYLCWKFGEHRIEYWHGIDEGFRGRKPIDQDFLDNHEGDLEQ
jgi:hypothetical protein